MSMVVRTRRMLLRQRREHDAHGLRRARQGEREDLPKPARHGRHISATWSHQPGVQLDNLAGEGVIGERRLLNADGAQQVSADIRNQQS